jgi:hypothetical protein
VTRKKIFSGYVRKDTRMNEQEPHNHPAGPFIGIGTALGVGLGTAVGVALGNIALGVGIGIGLGLTLGALWGLRQQRKHDDS